MAENKLFVEWAKRECPQALTTRTLRQSCQMSFEAGQRIGPEVERVTRRDRRPTVPTTSPGKILESGEPALVVRQDQTVVLGEKLDGE